MTADESDDADLAPVPPYERIWRHPAERAAHERKLFQAASTPPPLSRRSSMLIAAFACVVSLLVFTVSVPKGVENRGQQGEDTTTPAASSLPTPPVKGVAINRTIAVVGEHGSTTALAVGIDTLITALEDVTSNGTVRVALPSGESVDGRITAVDATTGLAIIDVDGQRAPELARLMIHFDGAGSSGDIDFTPDYISRLTLVDFVGAQQPESDDGLTTATDATRRIVHTARPIEGVAAVTDARGGIVGVAVRQAQATWIMSVRALRDILSKVFGISIS